MCRYMCLFRTDRTVAVAKTFNLPTEIPKPNP